MANAKTLTYRELLTLARERLGSAAAALKTREELLLALGLDSTEPAEENSFSPQVVTGDFFIARKKTAAKN